MENQPDPAKELFLEALQQPTPEARMLYVNEACDGKPELRQAVESLLEAHELAGDFLQQDALGQELFLAEAKAPFATFGTRYRLLGIIGEGGFGIVYRAEQTEPIVRQVAVKVIKPGMDSRQVIARFEAERQALALMDHPNIAKVLDAGVTDTGRPYFVMDLVQGVPITEYSDQQQLTTDQRLDLFVQVCLAVQHAHQKGIIHRDLKPSNILVLEQDAKAVPKVIDFGVAKAMGRKLTNKTLVTLQHQFLGTPVYCCPEQVDPAAEDVDTRADIYSLGVLLYELLTGHTPFDPKELQQTNWHQVLQMLREMDPPRPSTRLTTLGAKELDNVARLRQTDSSKLPSQLRGDLDWIVMKALEKDRNRRYASASTMARDIEHYQRHEPVEAAAPSLAYRTGKFIRRHRIGVTAGCTVALALIVGVIVSLWQARQAEAARWEAEKLITFMLGDLSDRLIPLGRPDLMAPILDKATNFFNNLPIEKLSPSQEYNRSLAFEHMGRLNFIQTRQKAAETFYRQALVICEKAVAANPRNLEWQRGLARISQGLCEVLYNLANQDEYIYYAQHSLNILTNLLQRDPNDSVAKFLLGANYYRMGIPASDIDLDTNESFPYLRSFEQARDIYQSLLKDNPTNTQVQLELGRILSYIGTSLQLTLQTNFLEQSLAAGRQSLTILSNLIHNFPQNLAWKTDLLWNYVWMTRAYLILGRPGDEEIAYQHLQAIRALIDVIASQRGNAAEFIYNEALYYQYLGWYLEQRDPAQTAECLRKSLQMYLKVLNPEERSSTTAGDMERNFYITYETHLVGLIRSARIRHDTASAMRYWRDLLSVAKDRPVATGDPSVLDRIGIVLEKLWESEKPIRSRETNIESKVLTTLWFKPPDPQALTSALQSAPALSDCFYRASFLVTEIISPKMNVAGKACWVSQNYYWLVRSHFSTSGVFSPLVLIPQKAAWKYHADTADQKPVWKEASFNDQNWNWESAAQNGLSNYSTGSKIVTHYFRKEFNVTKPAEIKSLLLRILRRDGVVVYLNGREILRNNLPAGSIGSQTAALRELKSKDELTYLNYLVPTNLLLPKKNIIAAEVHMIWAYTKPIGAFDLELLANVPAPDELLKGTKVEDLQKFFESSGLSWPEIFLETKSVLK